MPRTETLERAHDSLCVLAAHPLICEFGCQLPGNIRFRVTSKALPTVRVRALNLRHPGRGGVKPSAAPPLPPPPCSRPRQIEPTSEDFIALPIRYFPRWGPWGPLGISVLLGWVGPPLSIPSCDCVGGVFYSSSFSPHADCGCSWAKMVGVWGEQQGKGGWKRGKGLGLGGGGAVAGVVSSFRSVKILRTKKVFLDGNLSIN